jgi:hypothetical protein
MSFVKTLPAALAAAAGQLQGIGTSMAAQNAAAASPTTGVVPAAADEVSALQATQFAAYGSLYQSVSAQAQAIHEMFVNTLGTSAGSYGATEAANATAASSSSSSGLSSILGLLGFNSGTTGINGATSQLVNIGGGNWASAASDLLGMAGGGLLPSDAGADVGAEAGGLAAGLGGGLDGAALSGAVGPAGLGGAPVLAGLGQASSVGALSVPPTWAGEVVPVASTTPATLTGAGWTAAAPHSAVTTMPAGMPSVASAGRGGYGFGAPRYGVKPTVMPKPAVV